MTPFGYTILGFGSGVSGDVPIAEDIVAAEADCEATTEINVQNAWTFDLDPFNEHKIVAAYRDDGTYGNDFQVVCGTIAEDGTTVTWGTIVEVSPRYGAPAGVAFDPNTENSFVIQSSARDASNNRTPEITAGTLDGTTITLGSNVDLSECTAHDYMNNHMPSFNPAQAGQVCIVASGYDSGSCAGGYYRGLEFKVCTVSGTTITKQTHVSGVSTGAIGQSRIVWDKVTPNKGYLFFSCATYPSVIPFTMSGDTPSFGTRHTINSYTDLEQQMGCTMATGGRLVSIYKDGGHIRVKVGNDDATDESGTITWGTEVTVADFEDEGSHAFIYPAIESDINTPNKVLLGYNIPVTGECSRWMVGTITGTNTITLGSWESAIAHSGSPDINAHIVATPSTWATPGRIYTGHNYTGDGSASILVRHQLPSFEL